MCSPCLFALLIASAPPGGAPPQAPARPEPRRLTPFWEGEEVGVRFDPSRAPLAHVSTGLQAGAMPLQFELAPARVLALGVGARVGWGPMWQLAGLLRGAYGGADGLVPRVYLQGGPVWMRSALGFELEAGAETFFGGLFARTLSEPAADGARTFTVVVGVRVALVTLALGSLVAVGIGNVLSELFGLER
jgi:hypothetical protein